MIDYTLLITCLILFLLQFLYRFYKKYRYKKALRAYYDHHPSVTFNENTFIFSVTVNLNRELMNELYEESKKLNISYDKRIFDILKLYYSNNISREL